MKKGLAIFGLGILGASAHALMVDDFITGSYNSGAFSAGSTQAWTASADSIGGIRYTDLTITSNPFGGDAKTRVITSPGILDVSTDADVDTNFLLGYGYANSSTTSASNQLNQNFSSSPIVEVNFRTNDVAQPVVVTLYTNSGASSFTRTLSVGGGITSANPQSYLFDFTSDAANLGDVDGISIFFDPTPGGDFSLNYIQTVPEPASLAVLAIGGAAMLRRRKK